MTEPPAPPLITPPPPPAPRELDQIALHVGDYNLRNVSIPGERSAHVEPMFTIFFVCSGARDSASTDRSEFIVQIEVAFRQRSTEDHKKKKEKKRI